MGSVSALLIVLSGAGNPDDALKARGDFKAMSSLAADGSTTIVTGVVTVRGRGQLNVDG